MSVDGLAQRTLGGLGWGGAGTAAMLLSQLGVMAVMARLLSPAQFGLMAMALVALRLFGLVAQMGIATALVQRPQLEPHDVRVAVGLTWAVCLPVTALALAAAPLMGAFFDRSEVVPLLQVLALSLPISGLGAVATALLRRAMRFRTMALVEASSYLLGYGAAGIAAAAAGWGVWALVAANLGQALTAWLGAWACTRHSLRPRWSGDRHALAGYGVRHMAISLVEFAAANLDTAVIGRVLGEAALGLYNRALLLATLPVEKLAGIVSRVALPVLSAVQDDRRKVGSTFLLALAGIGVASGAVSLGLAAAADEVVRVLLGPAWGAAVPVLRVLAWAAPLMVMSHVCGVVCDATAQLRFKLAVQSGALVMLALLIMLWLDHGVLGVAFALVVTELLRLGAYLAGLGRALHCRGRDLARVLAAVAAGAALVQLAVAAVARLGRGQLAAPALLAAEMLAGACALALTLVIALRLLAPTAAGSIARQHLPGVERLMLWAGGPQR